MDGTIPERKGGHAVSNHQLIPEDYGRLTRLSSLAQAPDGATAYVKYFWQDNAWQRRVEIAKEGNAREISLGGTVEKCPAFSKDGNLLWFLTDGRIALHDRRTDKTEEALPLPAGFEAVDVLPMSNGCLFVCRREIRETPPADCDWEMPLVAEELRFRNDADHGFVKKYTYRLYRYDGSLRQLAEAEKPFQALALLPDESAALYAQGAFKLLNLASGEEQEIKTPFAPGGDYRPIVSADGRYALVAVSTSGMEISLRRVWLDGQEHEIDEIEHEPAGLTEGAYMDTSPERKTIIAQGKEANVFYVAAHENHEPGLWRVTVTGNKLCYEQMNLSGLVMETAGELDEGVAVLYGSGKCPPVPSFWKKGESAALPLCPSHNGWLSPDNAAAYQSVETPSQDGRVTLTGSLLLPEEQQKNIPLLVWVHGGPSGYWAKGFNLEIQCAVSQGFAVLLPNPRGSTGRGNDYANPEHAYDGGAANDVLCLLDEALRRYPQLDKNAVSVLGGSYGGYMAAWMAGSTARFRSAVVIKGVTNWLFIHFCSSQAGQSIFNDYRDFQDFLVDTVKMSPIYHAGEVNIPTLIIHGEKDQQVPPENAHQFYTALKDCHPDLPVKLMLLPDCCHGYSRDALPDYIAIQKETLDWLNQYGKEQSP